jgi:hypothetical protein
MPFDQNTHSPDVAERRVRERFARQSADLVKWQQGERQKDLRTQKQELDRLTGRENALREQRRQALERLDRFWQQERDKLGLSPASAPAPSFGPGGAPQRDLQEEYRRKREHYELRREQLKERFDERLAGMQRERADLHHTFLTANQARDRIYLDARIDLADRQNKAFDRLVRQELECGDKSMRREFGRRTHPNDREI